MDFCQGGSNEGAACTDDSDCDDGVTCGMQACPAECMGRCAGSYGDVLNPWEPDDDNPDFTESRLVRDACLQAWDDLIALNSATDRK